MIIMNHFTNLKYNISKGLFAASIMALWLITASSQAIGQEQKGLNVILIMADDISSREFSLYNPDARAQTPTLDELGTQGVHFKTAWATPMCQPTRAMIMTGKYAYQHEYWNNDVKAPATEETGLPPNWSPTFFHVAKEAGYRTGWFGKSQLVNAFSHDGLTNTWGVDRYFLTYANNRNKTRYNTIYNKTSQSYSDGKTKAYFWQPNYLTNCSTVPEAQRERNHHSQNKDDFGPAMCLAGMFSFMEEATSSNTPFFAYWATHLGHLAANWGKNPTRLDYAPVPTNERDINNFTNTSTDHATSGGSMPDMINYMDDCFEMIFTKLRELDIDKNTVIIITTDNGSAGDSGKGDVAKAGGCMVPLVVYAPSLSRIQGASDIHVDLTDIHATIADICGVPLTPNRTYHGVPLQGKADGKSLLPVLRGEKTHKEYIASYFATVEPPKSQPMVQIGDWIIDGDEKVWYTGGQQDLSQYEERTHATDEASIKMVARLRELAQQYSETDYSDPWWVEGAAKAKKKAEKYKRGKKKK